MERIQKQIDMTAEHMKNLFGENDSYIKKIERDFHVIVVNRDGYVRIIGETDEDVSHAYNTIENLLKLSERGNELQEQNIDYAIELGRSNQAEAVVEMDRECICHTVSGKPVKPKTLGQKEYVDAIRNNMVVFGMGPAGTGKTYLAMAMAISAFKNNEVSRIILTRPAIEAGEKLGFLPGDLQSKVDPYLRPLYDALHEMLGYENYGKMVERGIIEVAPLAYMRGRTLSNAFIILDEAQNTTKEQMKMFLTRMGEGSKMVVTGDATQIDLPSGVHSGLLNAIDILNNVEGIAICRLGSKDVVRHDLVQKIVNAYENYNKKH